MSQTEEVAGYHAALESYNGSGTQFSKVTDKLEEASSSVFWNDNDITKQIIYGSSLNELTTSATSKSADWGGIQTFSIDNKTDCIGDLYLSISLEFDTPDTPLDTELNPRTITTMLQKPSPRDALTDSSKREKKGWYKRGIEKGDSHPKSEYIGFPNGWKHLKTDVNDLGSGFRFGDGGMDAIDNYGLPSEAINLPGIWGVGPDSAPRAQAWEEIQDVLKKDKDLFKIDQYSLTNTYLYPTDNQSVIHQRDKDIGIGEFVIQEQGRTASNCYDNNSDYITSVDRFRSFNVMDKYYHNGMKNNFNDEFTTPTRTDDNSLTLVTLLNDPKLVDIDLEGFPKSYLDDTLDSNVFQISASFYGDPNGSRPQIPSAGGGTSQTPVASPIFTSNNTITTDTNWTDPTGWYVTESSFTTAYFEGWKAFSDGSSWGGWHADEVQGTVTTQWVQITYPKKVILKSYTTRKGQYTNAPPENWRMQGSNNGTTWTDTDVLRTTGWPTANGVDGQFDTSFNTVGYTMYRFIVENVTWVTNGNYAIRQIRLYTIDDPNSGPVITPTDLTNYNTSLYNFLQNFSLMVVNSGVWDGTITSQLQQQHVKTWGSILYYAHAPFAFSRPQYQWEHKNSPTGYQTGGLVMVTTERPQNFTGSLSIGNNLTTASKNEIIHIELTGDPNYNYLSIEEYETTLGIEYVKNLMAILSSYEMEAPYENWPGNVKHYTGASKLSLNSYIDHGVNLGILENGVEKNVNTWSDESMPKFEISGGRSLITCNITAPGAGISIPGAYGHHLLIRFWEPDLFDGREITPDELSKYNSSTCNIVNKIANEIEGTLLNTHRYYLEYAEQIAYHTAFDAATGTLAERTAAAEAAANILYNTYVAAGTNYMPVFSPDPGILNRVIFTIDTITGNGLLVLRELLNYSRKVPTNTIIGPQLLLQGDPDPESKFAKFDLSVFGDQISQTDNIHEAAPWRPSDWYNIPGNSSIQSTGSNRPGSTWTQRLKIKVPTSIYTAYELTQKGPEYATNFTKSIKLYAAYKNQGTYTGIITYINVLTEEVTGDSNNNSIIFNMTLDGDPLNPDTSIGLKTLNDISLNFLQGLPALSTIPNKKGYDNIISPTLIEYSEHPTLNPYSYSYLDRYLSYSDSEEIKKTGKEYIGLKSDGTYGIYRSDGVLASDLFVSYLTKQDINNLVNYYNNNTSLNTPLTPAQRTLPNVPSEYLNNVTVPDNALIPYVKKIEPVEDPPRRPDNLVFYQSDFNGYCTVISKDGNTYAVSQGRMYGDEFEAVKPDGTSGRVRRPGLVRVYKRNENDDSWELSKTFRASTSDLASFPRGHMWNVSNGYKQHVDLSSDGNRIVIGDAGGPNKGFNTYDYNTQTKEWNFVDRCDFGLPQTYVASRTTRLDSFWQVQKPLRTDVHEGDLPPGYIFGSQFGSTLSLSADGNRIALTQLGGSQGKGIYGGEPWFIYKGHSRPVNSVAWSPDNSKLISGSDDYKVSVWDITSLDDYRRPFYHGRKIVQEQFSAEGWGINNKFPYKAVAWAPNNSYVVAAAAGKQTTTVAISGGFREKEMLVRVSVDSNIANFPTIEASTDVHTDSINSIAISPNSFYIFTASSDTTVKRMDYDFIQVETSPTSGNIHTQSVNTIDCAYCDPFPHDYPIVTGSDDHDVIVWNFDLSSSMIGNGGHSEKVNVVRWNSLGDRFVSGSDDNHIKIWTVTNNSVTCTDTIDISLNVNGTRVFPQAPVTALDWSGVQNLIIVGSSNPAKLWVYGSPITTTPDPYDYNTDPAAQPNILLRTTPELDYTNAAHYLYGRKGYTLKAINSLKFSHDGTRFAIGGGDNSVQIWDTFNMQSALESSGDPCQDPNPDNYVRIFDWYQYPEASGMTGGEWIPNTYAHDPYVTNFSSGQPVEGGTIKLSGDGNSYIVADSKSSRFAYYRKDDSKQKWVAEVHVDKASGRQGIGVAINYDGSRFAYSTLLANSGETTIVVERFPRLNMDFGYDHQDVIRGPQNSFAGSSMEFDDSGQRLVISSPYGFDSDTPILKTRTRDITNKVKSLDNVITYVVTIPSTTALYHIDGVQQPNLNLFPGFTYVFDWSRVPLMEFKISSTIYGLEFPPNAAAIWHQGTDYTDEVSYDLTKLTTTITVTNSTPATLWYYANGMFNSLGAELHISTGNDPVIKTFIITVKSTNYGNKYYIDGDKTPYLKLEEGSTYIFDWTAASTHPFKFSISPDGTHGNGVDYTTNVTIDNVNYKTTIKVPKIDKTTNTALPLLYYYCQNHPNMGAAINITDDIGVYSSNRADFFKNRDLLSAPGVKPGSEESKDINANYLKNLGGSFYDTQDGATGVSDWKKFGSEAGLGIRSERQRQANGVVYVYDNVAPSNEYYERWKLMCSLDASSGERNKTDKKSWPGTNGKYGIYEGTADGFGTSLSVNGDGTRIIVGAPLMSTIGKIQEKLDWYPGGGMTAAYSIHEEGETAVIEDGDPISSVLLADTSGRSHIRETEEEVGRSYVFTLSDYKYNETLTSPPKKDVNSSPMTFTDGYNIVNDAQRRLNHDITDFVDLPDIGDPIRWDKQFTSVPNGANYPPLRGDYENPVWADSDLKSKVKFPLLNIIKKIEILVDEKVWQTITYSDLLSIYSTEMPESLYNKLGSNSSGSLRNDGTRQAKSSGRWIPGKKYDLTFPIPAFTSSLQSRFNNFTQCNENGFLSGLTDSFNFKVRIYYNDLEKIWDINNVSAMQGYTAPIYTVPHSTIKIEDGIDSNGNPSSLIEDGARYETTGQSSGTGLYVTNFPEAWKPNISFNTKMFGKKMIMNKDELNKLKNTPDGIIKKINTTQSINTTVLTIYNNTGVSIDLDPISIYSSHLMINIEYKTIFFSPHLKTAQLFLNSKPFSKLDSGMMKGILNKTLGIYSNEYINDKDNLDPSGGNYVYPLSGKFLGGSSIQFSNFDTIRLELFFESSDVSTNNTILAENTEINITVRGQSNITYKNGLSTIAY